MRRVRSVEKGTGAAMKGFNYTVESIWKLWGQSTGAVREGLETWIMLGRYEICGLMVYLLVL